MKQIHYKCDFTLSLTLSDVAAQPIGDPGVDFEGKVYTASRLCAFAFSRCGGEMKGCAITGSTITLLLDGHSLPPGRLRGEMTFHIPDASFPDGEGHHVLHFSPEVELTPEPPASPVSEINIPLTLPLLKGEKGEPGPPGDVSGLIEDFTEREFAPALSRVSALEQEQESLRLEHVGLWDELAHVKDLIASAASGEVKSLLASLGYEEEDIRDYMEANLNYDLGLTMDDLRLSAARWQQRDILDKPFGMPILPKWTEALAAQYASPYAMQQELFIQHSGRYFPALDAGTETWDVSDASYVASLKGILYTTAGRSEGNRIRFGPVIFGEINVHIPSSQRCPYFSGCLMTKKVTLHQQSPSWDKGMFHDANNVSVYHSALLDISGVDVSKNTGLYAFARLGYSPNKNNVVKIGEWDLRGSWVSSCGACFEGRRLKDSTIIIDDTVIAERVRVTGLLSKAYVDNCEIRLESPWETLGPAIDIPNGMENFRYFLTNGDYMYLVGKPSRVYSPDTGFTTSDAYVNSEESEVPLILHLPRMVRFSTGASTIVNGALFDIGGEEALRAVYLESRVPYRVGFLPWFTLPEYRRNFQRLYDWGLLKESMLSWVDRSALGYSAVTVSLPNQDAQQGYGIDSSYPGAEETVSDYLDDDFVATMAAKGYTCIFAS